MRAFWFSVVFLFFTGAFAQTLKYREVSLPDEVRTSSLDLIYTDREGFLWLAAGSGLYWYDGLSFNKIFTDTSGRGADHISTLYDGGDGLFWIGWRSGSISKISGDSAKAYQPEEGTPSVPIVKFAEDDAGRLWMATDGEGLYMKDESDRWHNFNTDDGLPSDECYDLVSLGNEVMLATDQGLAVCSFSDAEKKLRLIGRGEGLSDQIVKSLFVDSAGILAAFYEPSINFLSESGEVQDTMGAPQEDAHIVRRYGEIIWWLSERGNLYRKSEGSRWVPVEPARAQRTRIKHLAADHEGHLWISTDKGLFLLDQWYGQYPTEKPATAVSYADSVIWYAQGGGLFRLDRELGSSDKVWEGEDLILTLYTDHQGRVWGGTFDGGVILWNPVDQKMRRFTESEGLANNNVLSIDGSEDAIWFGTFGGVSRISVGAEGQLGEIETFSGEGEAGLEYIYAVHADDNIVYLGTDGDGVLRWNGQTFKQLSEELTGEVVLAITTDQSGKLWWVNADGMLHSWSSEEGAKELPPFSEETGRIAGLMAAGDESVFVFHEGGLHRWYSAEQRWVSYSKSFDLGSFQPELHAYDKGAGSSLFIGTGSGITKLYLDLLPKNISPHTTLAGVELFLEPTAERNFGSDENHITFKYIGRWYTDPTAVRYRLKLTGYDLDWIESRNTEITYPKLPPGQYSFSVVGGINGYYPEDQVQTVDFVILSPWYTRWYFILLAVVILIGLVLLFMRLRLQNEKQKQEREKQRVRAQYEALRSQVNPHFLFNSFNTLMAMIEDNDKEEAAGYLSDLSDFFRHILEFRDVDLITLEEEMDLVKTYLDLQSKRYGQSLQVEIEIGEQAMETKIPPLTLQLLLENVFKHNVISRSKPLKVRVYTEAAYLTVWNKLQPKAKPDPSTGYGLDSIRKKYKFYTEKPVKVESTDEHFVVYLPLIQS